MKKILSSVLMLSMVLSMFASVPVKARAQEATDSAPAADSTPAPTPEPTPSPEPSPSPEIQVVTDLCPNMDGVQDVIPDGGCVDTTVTPPVDDSTTPSDSDTPDTDTFLKADTFNSFAKFQHSDPTATLIAKKIVCPTEDLLPNWGNGGPDITSSTATNFLKTHTTCSLQPWTFEYASDKTANPGDSISHADGWTTFDSETPTSITAGSPIWVREQSKDGYIAFSGDTTAPRDNVSAEFYCSTDVLNYDNYDRVSSVVKDHTYNCVGFNVPTTPPTPLTANVTATKIVCPTEDLLPNWGDNGADITSSTASSFISKNPTCSIQPWDFAWAKDGTPNPGDNLTGTGGADWTGFSGTTAVPAGVKIWFREQPKADYIPFTGENVDKDVSAEFYCGSDVVNYDNREAITTVAGQNYDCVAFNVPVTPPETCDAKATSMVVSDADTTDTTDSTPAAVLTVIHPAWTANFGADAKWIWATDPVHFPTDNDLTKVFTKTFNITGTPTSGSLEIAADNTYIVKVNGTVVGQETVNGNTFANPNTYDVLSALHTGSNTIEITATNWVHGDGHADFPKDAGSNPAGIIYKLSIGNDECHTPPPVDVCPNLPGDQSTIPDGYTKNEDGQCVPPPTVNTCPLPSSIAESGDDVTAETVNVGSEQSLQSILDTQSYGVNVTTDQKQYQLWNVTPGSEVTVSAKFVKSITAHPAVFGYYTDSNMTNFVPLFKTVNITGQEAVTLAAEGDSFTVNTGSATTLGFAIKSYDADGNYLNTYATENDLSDGANDQAVVYNPKANQYVVAFEDLQDGDFDYNDVVVQVDLNCQDIQTPPTKFKVHIHKYLTNVDAAPTQVQNDSTAPAFPMVATYTIAGIGDGSDPYLLGDNGGAAGSDDGLKYAANTISLSAGDSYATNENTDGSVVVPADSEVCPAGKYELVGYKVGTTLALAEAASISTIAPSFPSISSDEYVIVVNQKCADSIPTGTLKITKYACPADTTVVRSQNGVGTTPPAGCVPESGVKFGYTYDSTGTGTPGLFGDPTPFTPFALTDVNGVTTLTNASTTGRYVVVELNDKGTQSTSTDELGLYCEADAGGDTNDNQEVAVITAGNTTNCVAYNKAPVVAEPSADVSITKTVSDNTPDNGQTVTYTITATNAGPDSASNVVVTDVLPAGLVFGSETHSTGSYSSGTWTIPTLASGPQNAVTITITATVSAEPGTTITNNATETSSTGDSNSENNVGTATLVVNTPDGGEPTNTSNTVVVRAADLETTTNIPTAATNGSGKWFFYNDTNDTINNTLGSFVTGPASAPAGTGSAEMTDGANPNDRLDIANYGFSGTDLSAIASLGYSAYSHSGVAGATESPYLVFNVSFNGTSTYQNRLVYVPSANGLVPQDSWNTFDTINGGAALWTWSGYAKGPDGTISTADDNTWPDGNTNEYRTWSAIKTAFPSAEVLSLGGLMGIRVGEPGPTNYTGDVDAFVIGIKTGLNTNTTTYDFEPTDVTPPTPPAEPNTKSKTTSHHSGGGIFFKAPGQVLGAETTCGIYVDKFLKKGLKGNDVGAVKAVQQFLKDYANANIVVDGVFGPGTEAALKAFQISHKDHILDPWNLLSPTGIFYLTTQTEVNNIMCPSLGLPIPTNLIPFSKNPQTPKH